MALTKQDVIKLARLTVIQYGGVDNWDWFGESLSDADLAEQPEDMTDEEYDLAVFDALDNGGVDNWDGYGFAFDEFRWDDYLDYVDEYEGDLADIKPVTDFHVN